VQWCSGLRAIGIPSFLLYESHRALQPTLDWLKESGQKGSDTNARALLQVILLLTYIPLASPPSRERKGRKRDRDSTRSFKGSRGRERESSGPPRTPQEDPAGALEMVMDRLSIWAAVADLGLDVVLDAPLAAKGKSKAKDREEDGMVAVLRRFWEEVLVPS
jgi:hypothetical protein